MEADRTNDEHQEEKQDTQNEKFNQDVEINKVKTGLQTFKQRTRFITAALYKTASILSTDPNSGHTRRFTLQENITSSLDKKEFWEALKQCEEIGTFNQSNPQDPVTRDIITGLAKLIMHGEDKKFDEELKQLKQKAEERFNLKQSEQNLDKQKQSRHSGQQKPVSMDITAMTGLFPDNRKLAENEESLRQLMDLLQACINNKKYFVAETIALHLSPNVIIKTFLLSHLLLEQYNENNVTLRGNSTYSSLPFYAELERKFEKYGLDQYSQTTNAVPIEQLLTTQKESKMKERKDESVEYNDVDNQEAYDKLIKKTHTNIQKINGLLIIGKQADMDHMKTIAPL